MAHLDRNPIAELLADAAACARARNWGSTAWRVADAVLLLTNRLERMGYSGEGYDIATHRGGMLKTATHQNAAGDAQATGGTLPLPSLFA